MNTASPLYFTHINGNTYNLNASAPVAHVLINGKDVSNYLAVGTSIGWYDVSKDSGRDATNANGKMILNIVSTKYRLDLVCRYLDDQEFIDFYSEIIKSPTMIVEFYNPFTGQNKTIQVYRGDRSATPYMQYSNGFILQGPTQALIEL